MITIYEFLETKFYKLCVTLIQRAFVDVKAHRLVRRRYYARGPNYVWHVDGYDKLKPYCFCIHGAIDGYSRKILWLEVADTNNHPTVIVK